MTELHRYLADNMRRRRNQLGLSQIGLAGISGLSSGYIGEIETGNKFPSPENIVRIAEALGVRPYVLLMGPQDLRSSSGSEAIYDAAGRLRDSFEKAYGDMLESFARGPSRTGKGGDSID